MHQVLESVLSSGSVFKEHLIHTETNIRLFILGVEAICLNT
jgi:hypothetical protein